MTEPRTVLGHTVRPTVVALACVVLAGAAVVALGTTAPLWLVPAALLAPDLTFVAGIGQHADHGAMPRRAVPFYNAAHRPVAPMTVMAAGLALSSPATVTIALVWLSHIVWDRGVGYGLRDKAGLLRRQQASAVVSARLRIVEGAVGAVEMALTRLNERDIVDLDEERKAAMVSNLMVVLCGDQQSPEQ